jgi:hypothetical protein
MKARRPKHFPEITREPAGHTPDHGAVWARPGEEGRETAAAVIFSRRLAATAHAAVTGVGRRITIISKS